MKRVFTVNNKVVQPRYEPEIVFMQEIEQPNPDPPDLATIDRKITEMENRLTHRLNRLEKQLNTQNAKIDRILELFDLGAIQEPSTSTPTTYHIHQMSESGDDVPVVEAITADSLDEDRDMQYEEEEPNAKVIRIQEVDNLAIKMEIQAMFDEVEAESVEELTTKDKRMLVLREKAVAPRDVIRLNRLLADPERAENFIKELRSFAGDKQQQVTRSLLFAVIPDRILCHFTWAGTAEKIGLCRMEHLVNCLIQAAREEFPLYQRSSFVTQVKSLIKNWRGRAKYRRVYEFD